VHVSSGLFTEVRYLNYCRPFVTTGGGGGSTLPPQQSPWGDLQANLSGRGGVLTQQGVVRALLRRLNMVWFACICACRW